MGQGNDHAPSHSSILVENALCTENLTWGVVLTQHLLHTLRICFISDYGVQHGTASARR